MKSSARLLLAALYTFNQLSWADPASAKEYMEWVFVSEKGGEQYFMKVRQSEVGEGAYVRDVTYGHNGAIVHQEASTRVSSPIKNFQFPTSKKSVPPSRRRPKTFWTTRIRKWPSHFPP